MNKFTYTSDESILILLNFISHTSSENKWDNYVLDHKKRILPPTQDIKQALEVNTWLDVQSIIKTEWTNNKLFQSIREPDAKMDVLSQEVNKLLIRKQLEPYKDLFTSAKSYNDFYSNKQNEIPLPHYQTVIHTFGSWNEFKQAIGLNTQPVGRRETYSYEQLVDILKEHRTYFTDARTWNAHADKEGLPKFTLMKNRIPLDVIRRYTNYSNRGSYTIEEIVKVVNEHKEVLERGKRAWEEFASNNTLPQYKTILKYLGSENLKRVKKGEELTLDDINKHPAIPNYLDN
ncbi:hypothetical protein M3649_20765 [Ureibacillus chungkukjangi]|uniref:hypothetical protein n=1 Tax=Ureibacillus chungkukjangi TaxID=1202712 RepID=UPI00203F2866|nr:hypothetical protein [Ureibacillus chungkukjangi]MCM3390520.1 hypothetical protein [Ureibacillus chungkukjangi]